MIYPVSLVVSLRGGVVGTVCVRVDSSVDRVENNLRFEKKGIANV